MKVTRYARHFSVDLICAITELCMLGYPVADDYELAVKRTIADRNFQSKKKREANAAAASLQDDISNGDSSSSQVIPTTGYPTESAGKSRMAWIFRIVKNNLY